MWACITFDTADDFSKPFYSVIYDGFQIEIERAASMEKCHHLYVEITNGNEKAAYEASFRFLSELAWLFRSRVEVLAYSGGSHKIPTNFANRKFNRVLNSIHLDDYEQIAFNPEQKLALGIYREGVSSNSRFYQFLSFFRVINLKCPKSKDIKDWVNRNIHKLSYDNALSKPILAELTKTGITDWGEHLYKTGRCAIAHASLQSGDPIADADNYDDISKIRNELSLIWELAKIFIREELNVPTRGEALEITLLKTFRKLFGEGLINKITAKEDIAISAFPKMPKMTFRIHDEPRKFYSLQNLDFAVVSAGKGRVVLSNQLQDWPLQTVFTIDFIKKEIQFDLSNIGINRNHPKYTDEFLLDILYFLKALCKNGRLEILDNDKNELMTRLSPYLSVWGTSEEIQRNIDLLENKA